MVAHPNGELRRIDPRPQRGQARAKGLSADVSFVGASAPIVTDTTLSSLATQTEAGQQPKTAARESAAHSGKSGRPLGPRSDGVLEMTTFDRFCNYVDAAHKMTPRLPRGATYAQVVAALADAGFLGATAGELETLGRHMRGFTAIRQERTVLLKETIKLMRQHRVADPEFGSAALSRIVPANDDRGQTVLHDLRQFEDDLQEAARRLGNNVPSLFHLDADETAENAFAWVYALQSGMLD
ncbi:MAG: hypothetical protein ACJ8AH_14885 [Stellaceae bacterium]